jgi:hypothetical protein
MPIADPEEHARRAIVRAIDNLTELVTILVDDPGDLNPSPTAFDFEPRNLFDLSFSRVGITSETLLSGFVIGLRTQLPEIRARIQELLKDLQPEVLIRLVFNVIRRELAKPLSDSSPAGGGASKGTSSKSSSKSSSSKKGAGKG